MARKQSVFVIDWRGPFQQETWGAVDDANVLYAATGRTPTNRRLEFRYCGITDSYFTARSRHHHKLAQIKDCELWLGWLAHPNPRHARRSDLELAESVIVYYWGDLLNERTVYSAPPTSAILISRWFTDKWKAGKKPAPFRKLPDIISWDAEAKRWRTGDFSKEFADY